MKTAMQELIEVAESSPVMFSSILMLTARLNSLEKEKEQIKKAYEAAIERPIENFEEGYYNMNYKDDTWNK